MRFRLTGPVRDSMSGREALELVRPMPPRVAVPVHFEGWSHFSERESDLHDVLDAADDDERNRLRWLARGEPAEV